MSESFFWKNKEKGILKTELFSKIAEEKAKMVHEDTHSFKENKSSQLRKFFDEVIGYKTQLISNPSEEIFEQKLPYIKMLHAKLAYSKARDLISDRCYQLFKGLIQEISDRKDFIAFADFFEAFIAFYKQYNNK